MGVAMPDAQHFEDAHPLPWIATRTGRPKSSSKLPRGAEDRRCTVFAFASPLRPPAPCRCRTSRSPARISIHRKYRAKRILGRPPRLLPMWLGNSVTYVPGHSAPTGPAGWIRKETWTTVRGGPRREAARLRWVKIELDLKFQVRAPVAASRRQWLGIFRATPSPLYARRGIFGGVRFYERWRSSRIFNLMFDIPTFQRP